jgi:branched-chain amino acid transport system substrate-binding protein
MRAVTAAAVLALVASAAACDAQGEAEPGEATLTIYVSAPLSGPGRADGRAVAEGARRALEEAGAEAGGFAIAAEYLDVAGRNETQPPQQRRGSASASGLRLTGRFDPVTAAENARTATEDSTTIAYIGEVDSGASRTSVPITNAAGILQVAPGSGASDLVRDEVYNDEVPSEVQGTGERTFAQLVPTYEPGERPGPIDFGDLGNEAMASVLAAIDRASDPADRESVIDAYLDGTERESPLGRYRITDTGEFEPIS